jgi:hypothetical protein
LRRCDSVAGVQAEKVSREAEPPSRRDDGGVSDLRQLLAQLSEQASPLERLSLAERFVRLATGVGTSGDVRARALRVVQDLSRRKPEERACCRGLDEMQQRVVMRPAKASAKRR